MRTWRKLSGSQETSAGHLAALLRTLPCWLRFRIVLEEFRIPPADRWIAARPALPEITKCLACDENRCRFPSTQGTLLL